MVDIDRGTGEVKWDEAGAVEKLGMAYHEIPMGKPLNAIDPEWVAALDEILRTAERPIVLHCGSGNRVAGLWAVWMVEHEGVAPSGGGSGIRQRKQGEAGSPAGSKTETCPWNRITAPYTSGIPCCAQARLRA